MVGELRSRMLRGSAEKKKSGIFNKRVQTSYYTTLCFVYVQSPQVVLSSLKEALHAGNSAHLGDR